MEKSKVMLKFKARALVTSGLVVAGMTIALSGAVAPADAQSKPYMDGCRLYAARQYKAALLKFQETLKDYPEDGNTYYYMGACYQQLRDNNSAKRCYTEAVKWGRSQPPAVNALKALLAMDVEYAKSVVPAWNWKLQRMLPGGGRFGNPDGTGPMPDATASSQIASRSTVTSYGGGQSSSSPSHTVSDSSLPAEGKFDIVDNPVGDNMSYVKGAINGKNVPHMLFDTGAEIVLFGRNQLEELGITPPSGPATSVVKGVGGQQEAWNMLVTLRVGNIERRNFKITVQQNMTGFPLLGQSFFKDYQCQVDKLGRQIRLVRNDVYSRSASVASSFSARDVVPFTRQGNLMVVQVQINGRTIPMCLDTGATNTQFTKEQLAQANVTIPANAEVGQSHGVGGSTSTLIFPVSRVKMGPIEKSQFPIQVVATAVMPYPLLGQDFFGDRRFSIDSINNAIKFH